MFNSQFQQRRHGYEPGQQPVDWIPAVDIVEHADRFELLADLPGVAPDDIEIDLHENVLRLAGRKANFADDSKRRHGERVVGHFCRRFTLPGTVDGDGIEARSEHGALRVSIPKLAEVQPRRIDIAAA